MSDPKPRRPRHTPGLWIVRQRKGQLGAPSGRFVVIGAATSSREEFFICEQPFAAVRGSSEEESEANSRLIGAAPILIAALDDLLTILASRPDIGSHLGFVEHAALDRARAAVAQAEGDERG